MSVKSDFLRAIVEEGITAARKYFGTGVETTIKKSKNGQKDIDKAKAKFKDNKVKAAKQKKADEAKEAKAKTKRERSKATEKNLRFRKNYEAPEGAGLGAETGFSVSSERAVGTKGEKVTVGKKSRGGGFDIDELDTLEAKSYRTKLLAAEKAVREGNATKAQKDFLDSHEARVTAQRDSTRRKISGSLIGRKKPKRTDYVDPETGEIFGNPTQRQITQAMSNLKARGKTKEVRELEAFLDEQRIKAGNVRPGESAVGRREGSRGMASGIRAEDRASIKDPINKRAKGGMAKKVQMMRGGAVKGKSHMYAAGGSVTDNLKRKKK